MGVFKSILGIFKPHKPAGRFYNLNVKCRRCGEVIQGRVDLLNDLSVEYDEQGKAGYFCRKVLMSDGGRCFQSIEVELTFDANHQLLQRQVHGGEFIDETASF